MKLFGPMYERAISWARHPRATWFLALLSLAEAVIFPVPPEVMLAPMCVARPRRGFLFAGISLAASLAGAVLGYLLGHFAYELIRPLFEALGWASHIDEGVRWLGAEAAKSPWAAFWALVLVGFAPIPLKFVTWAAGIVGMPMLPFLASMAVGRGKRVFLIALLIRMGGERAERALHRYIEPIGWAAAALLVVGVGWVVLRARGM